MAGGYVGPLGKKGRGTIEGGLLDHVGSWAAGELKGSTIGLVGEDPRDLALANYRSETKETGASETLQKYRDGYDRFGSAGGLVQDYATRSFTLRVDDIITTKPSFPAPEQE